jgi:hypothetical protein
MKQRIRSVHPGLFTDEAFVSCCSLARLLMIGIWTEADDRGVFEWKPVTLKMRLLPADVVGIDDLLADLTAAGMIKNVNISGKAYGLVRNFCRFQRPKKPTYRVALPHEFWNYVGLNADGFHPDHSRNPHRHSDSSPHVPNQLPTGTVPVPNQFPTRTGKAAQMEDGGGRKKEEGDSKNHIDKPIVVVVPPEPETAAGTTTTTKVGNDLVRGKAPKRTADPLGTPLPEDWIPDEACMKVAFDHGMDGAEVESEVPRFHAFNAQRGMFSQNWNKTWTLWCIEFKKRKAKEAAKPTPRVEVSNNAPHVPSERDWDFAAKMYAASGRWNMVNMGPEPTSPACRCPPDILGKHIVNHAAVPVLAAHAKVPA